MKISTDGHGKVTFRISEEPIRRAEPLFSPYAAAVFKLQMLNAGKYIRLRRTAFGFVIEVLNSAKFGIWRSWQGKQNREKRGSQGVEIPTGVDQIPTGVDEKRAFAGNIVDPAVTQQKDAAAALALKSNPEDSVWSFLEISPCGPKSFRSLLEAGWASRNGGQYSRPVSGSRHAKACPAQSFQMRFAQRWRGDE